MKFATYLTEIKGVSIYPIISLVLFVAFFSLVIIWAYRSNSDEIEHFENLPLEDCQVSNSNKLK